MELQELPECTLCTLTMNKTDRRPFACQYCNAECCMTCIQTYAATQAAGYNRKPRCFDPGCGKEFDDEFVETAVSKAGLRRVREGLLEAEMRASLPQMQGLAACYKLVKDGVSRYGTNPAGFVAATNQEICALTVRSHIYRAAIENVQSQRPSSVPIWSRQLDSAPGGMLKVSLSFSKKLRQNSLRLFFWNAM